MSISAILLEGFADTATNFAPVAEQGALSLLNNPGALVIGAVLIVATLLLIFFLKKIIINTILGIIIWAASVFVFHVSLPLVPSFVVAAIFGPAGIGVMMVLKFFGLLA